MTNLLAYQPCSQNSSAIPEDKGSYIFTFHLKVQAPLQIGRLGLFNFPAGIYHYCGSAHGMGGLKARLQRHLNHSAPQHWHIDYLKPWIHPIEMRWMIDRHPHECRWAQHLAAHPLASVPVPKFGASDCKQHCPAHLIILPIVGERLNDWLGQMH